LRDLWVETGSIAEGSASAVLEGRHYNRGVRLHKITFEALMRLAWRAFVNCIEREETNICSMELFSKVRELVLQHDKPKQVDLENILQDDNYLQLCEAFCAFLQFLRTNNGATSRFWMSYIDMVSTLLNFIRAAREGNWNLHMQSVRSIIP
jgi:hypothetical protein